MMTGKESQDIKERPLLKDFNLYILFGVTLMAVLGVASISPAFPKIMQELDISLGEVGLLITAFTVPGVVLTPFLGVLADRAGRRKLLVPSLILFGVAGTLCAFTKDFGIILFLRLIQGIGAASLGTLNVTLLGDLYKGRRRTTAMGYNASVLSIGTASYPAIGGGLAVLSWNYPFLLSFFAIPIGLVVLYALKNPEPENHTGFREYLRGAWKGIRNKRVIGLFIASIMTFIILYGPILTLLPVLSGERFGASALEIGLLLSAMSLSTAVISFHLGKLIRFVREAHLILIAFILYGVVLAMIPFIHDFWLLLVPSMIFGLAQGINIPTIQTLLASLAPIQYRAAFMSVNGMVLRIGQSAGPVIIGALATGFGAGPAFLILSGVAVLSFVMLAPFFRQ